MTSTPWAAALASPRSSYVSAPSPSATHRGSQPAPCRRSSPGGVGARAAASTRHRRPLDRTGGLARAALIAVSLQELAHQRLLLASETPMDTGRKRAGRVEVPWVRACSVGRVLGCKEAAFTATGRRRPRVDEVAASDARRQHASGTPCEVRRQVRDRGSGVDRYTARTATHRTARSREGRLPALPVVVPGAVARADSRGRRRALEQVGDGGSGGPQHRGEDRRQVEAPLTGRAHDAGQHLLGVGAVAGARLPPHTLRVTTAGRMACSARQLVASTDGSHKNRNTAGNRWPSVRRSAWRRPIAGGRRSGDRAPGFESAAGRRQAVRAQCACVAAAAQVEAGLEDRLHLRGPGTAGMVILELRAAPEQVRQTRVGCSPGKPRYATHPSRTNTPPNSAPRTVAAASNPRPGRIA